MKALFILLPLALLLVQPMEALAQTSATGRVTGRATTINCLSIVDFVATGLREEASRAQSVTHLRIESVLPVRQWTLDKSCYVGSEVTAVVVHDSRGRRAGTRLRFVPIKSPSEPPYAPGDEIVVALDQDRASRQYFSWGYGYSVRNGMVALNAPFDEFEEEIPVGVLFERLKEAR
jgi:hypothetical protein